MISAKGTYVLAKSFMSQSEIKMIYIKFESTKPVMNPNIKTVTYGCMDSGSNS